jgi:NitT/TauT family transport system substrate-binding protein
MMNLTHAPLLAGLGSGRIAKAMAPLRVEPRAFRAGPRVTEALLGDAIDVGTAGPAPVVIHHSRHARGGGGLRVLAGCASGGASFIVGKDSGIHGPSDLAGKRLGVTQIGTTQDVALRAWLGRHGRRTAAAGGDVTVLAIPSSVILDQMKRGELHGAWMAEPWATRLEQELGARRLLDERDLWPGRTFATAILTARASRAADPALERLVELLKEEVVRIVARPSDSLAEAYEEMKRHVGNPGSRKIFDKAAAYVDFTSDPVRESIVHFAEDAAALGLTQDPGSVAGLFG